MYILLITCGGIVFPISTKTILIFILKTHFLLFLGNYKNHY